MITRPIRKTALRNISITVNELNQLLFWAKIGADKSKGGSYYPDVLSTIVEYRALIREGLE